MRLQNSQRKRTNKRHSPSLFVFVNFYYSCDVYNCVFENDFFPFGPNNKQRFGVHICGLTHTHNTHIQINTRTQFIGIPTTSCIGLIFKEKFAQLQMPAADLTLIINVNSALSMSLGLINGPLLRAFGYRKISVIAAIVFSLGLIFTAFSDSISSLIINYGVITGLVIVIKTFQV